ncbi:MAG: ATP-binding protein [Candidatus Sumerlaeota bacterium]
MQKDQIRILLVEDNPVDAELVKTVLSTVGQGIVLGNHVQSLRESLDALSQEDFDLVMMDLSLPDSDPEKTVETMLEQAPDMPVVVLTGRSDEELALRAMAGGAQDYLVKGEVGSKGIIRSIRYAVERKALLERVLHMEERIHHIRRMDSLGQLAGGVAHHMNNILLGISGNVELIQMNPNIDGNTEKRLKTIQDLTQRATDLSRQMLACSGWKGADLGALNLNDIAQSMEALLGVSVGKHIELQCHYHDKAVMVWADESVLRQIILNLVMNAAEAIGAETDGRVTLETSLDCYDEAALQASLLVDKPKPGNYACLKVGDTGNGIDSQTLEKMFDPFFSTKFTGRGLGLASVEAQVRSMEGALMVESEQGKGSVFKVLLPECKSTFGV